MELIGAFIYLGLVYKALFCEDPDERPGYIAVAVIMTIFVILYFVK